jgi:NAD(P)-dependent dehydrogenase (short-subunit alcohol dehydrogenase family)
MKKFENKVVLITGGGTGIGKATAAAFVAEGAQVVIIGRRQAVLEETAKELGNLVHCIVGDVSKKGDPSKIINATVEKYGRLDVLVNGAGTGVMGPLTDTSDEDIENTYRTNVFGPLALTREAIPQLIKDKGIVINITSVMSNGVMAGSAMYASSKAALDHISRCLAAELGPVGVRVNAIAPGLTATDITAELREDENMLGMYVAQTPMGRLGDPNDIAGAVLLLADEKAGWVTGQIVQAGGGLML